MKMLDTSAIYFEIQCIIKSGVLTTSEDLGGGSASRVTAVERCHQNFGKWVPAAELRRFIDMLTLTGDSPGLAFDGHDHAIGMQDAPRLLYFANINELLQMLADLRAVVARKIID